MNGAQGSGGSSVSNVGINPYSATTSALDNAASQVAQQGDDLIRSQFHTGQPVWITSPNSPNWTPPPRYFPYTPGAQSAAESAKLVGRLGVVGKAAGVAGVVITGYESYQLSDGPAAERALETVGRTSAVLSGSAAGAQLVGPFGSPGGPLGVAAFATVGAVGGGLVGAGAWDWARGNLFQTPPPANGVTMDCNTVSFASC